MKYRQLLNNNVMNYEISNFILINLLKLTLIYDLTFAIWQLLFCDYVEACSYRKLRHKEISNICGNYPKWNLWKWISQKRLHYTQYRFNVKQNLCIVKILLGFLSYLLNNVSLGSLQHSWIFVEHTTKIQNNYLQGE